MTDTPRDMPSLLDGRLIRLLDGEATADERDELLQLLESSAEARERYASLEGASGRLSESLTAETDVPVLPPLDLPQRVAPGRTIFRFPAVSPGWRVAATVAFLLAAGLTVQPVRAWLVTGVNRVMEMLSPEDQPVPAVVVEQQEDSGPSRVSFVPDTDVFVIEVSAPQATGTLFVETVTGVDQVVAAVVNGEGENLLVLPSGLRIGNQAASTADYRITVPARLSSVEIRVAGAVVATLTPGSQPGRWELRLDGT